MIRRLVFKLLPILLLSVMSVNVFALFDVTPKPLVQVALLDRIYAEAPSLSKLAAYERAYLAGAKVAKMDAPLYGYRLQYKPFLFGGGPIDILDELPKIKAWRADVVLGPSSSDECLLLGKYLTSIMVVSSYASDVNIQQRYSNFFSTLLPDNRIMTMLAHFTHKRFPKKSVFVLMQTDCKQCVDVGKSFIKQYQALSSSNYVTSKTMFFDHIDQLDIHSLIGPHINDVIFVLTALDLKYNYFARHVANAFPGKRLTFMSDQDNWGNEGGDTPLTKTDLPYDSYRIGPLLYDRHSALFMQFYRQYLTLFGKPPTDAVSFETYNSIVSTLVALNKYPDPGKGDKMHDQILYSYRHAMKNNPDWFRAKNYGIYLLTSTGEMLVKKMQISHYH